MNLDYRFAKITLLLLVGLLSGCSLLNREKDVVQISPLPTVVNQLAIQKSWQRRIGQGVGPFYSRLQPAYHQDKLYVADRQGNVAALNAKTGDIIWNIRLTGPDKKCNALLSGGITVADKQLLLASENAEVIALQAVDGQIAWRQSVSGEVISQPLCYQGMVIIHTNNGALEALEQQTGQMRWQQILDIPMLSLRGSSNPVACIEGIVVIGSKNGCVHAFTVEQGELLWQQQIAQPTGATELDRLNDVAATPRIVGDRVFALSYHGTLSALALHSGQVIWQRPISSASDFMVDGDRLIIVDQSDAIIALDSRSGLEIWRQTALRYRQLTSPTRYQDCLVVGDAQGYLHWLSPDDGQFVAQQWLHRSGLYTAPVVTGEQLVVQTRKGQVFAVSK
ncbi:MAG: outer membrane protein assembly factor BamB [Candidatus Symbiodolus clandestinus]